jgi:hypothetical protein
MPLEKITITTERGKTFRCQFNPERYTVNKSVQLSEVGIPGLDSPIVQFVRGQNERITMELFFDTTDSGMVENVKDVRTETRKVYALLKVDAHLHAPPRFVMYWGNAGQLTSPDAKIPPWLVLESVSEEFTLFSPTGVPLRARLNVTIREAWTVDEQLTNTARQSSDRTKLRRVRRGQTLSHIAHQEYNDTGAWRPIAEANQLDNPRVLEPGTLLVVPRHTSGVA